MRRVFGRLRNKLLAFVLGVAVFAISGTTFLVARTFVAEKRDYVLELSSIVAPNAAAAISNRLDTLRAQLVVFDEILKNERGDGQPEGEILQTSFRKLAGVERLEVYDAQGMLASIHAMASGTSVAALGNPRGAHRIEFRQEGAGPPRLLYRVPVGRHLYALELKQEVFTEYLEAARALSASWIAEDGSVILGNRAEEPWFRAFARVMVESIHGQGRQAVVAKEVIAPGGDRYVAAISPVPQGEGSFVLARVPLVQASQMASQVIRSLLPFIAAILVLAVVLGVVFSSRIVRPIENLTEATARIADGEWKVTFGPQPDDEIGKLVRAFGSMGAELEKREQDLNDAHRRLIGSERLAALGKFSAGLAHEVKNPLNSIFGFAQLLERRLSPPPDENVAKYVRFIMDETKRADRIIADLLTFARQRPPTLAPARLEPVLQRAIQLFEPQASAAGVRLRAEIAAPAAMAELDAEQFYQVLLNLMTNATHAMQDNPPERERQLSLRLGQEGGSVVVEVNDTGGGIAPENLKRIFEPFFTTKGVGKGTGLGLALCHGIIQQHHGSIDVVSKVGGGTTFRIQLPEVRPVSPESGTSHAAV